MSKIGIIVEGGGMKCAYSAGVLDRFIDDQITFDYAIGVSAGSANLASFLAGQRGRNRRYYTQHPNDPEYFGIRSYLKTGNLFNLQYIYGTLTNENGKDPLDYDAFAASPTDFRIVATDAETGHPHYFRKSQIHRNDYRIIMASCALPAACRPQTVNGRKYFDGGVSDSIPVARAFHDGCDKVVIILSKPRNFVKTPEEHRLFYTLSCFRYPRIVRDLDHRHIMYRECQDTMFAMEQQGKAFLFAPSAPPEMSTYTMDTKIEEELYQLGLRDYAALHDSFLEFMER